jgi:hypothetical protein
VLVASVVGASVLDVSTDSEVLVLEVVGEESVTAAETPMALASSEATELKKSEVVDSALDVDAGVVVAEPSSVVVVAADDTGVELELELAVSVVETVTITSDTESVLEEDDDVVDVDVGVTVIPDGIASLAPKIPLSNCIMPSELSSRFSAPLCAGTFCLTVWTMGALGSRLRTFGT